MTRAWGKCPDCGRIVSGKSQGQAKGWMILPAHVADPAARPTADCLPTAMPGASRRPARVRRVRRCPPPGAAAEATAGARLP